MGDDLRLLLSWFSDYLVAQLALRTYGSENHDFYTAYTNLFMIIKKYIFCRKTLAINVTVHNIY